MTGIPVKYIAVCQWCGKRGEIRLPPNGATPLSAPRIPGRCDGHPSGKPNMPHNPHWERM